MSTVRFYVAGLIGAVMIGASIALVAWLAHSLALTGSCSSSGYTDKGRPVPVCSSKETVRIIAIFPAILLGLLGLVVSGLRAPRHRRTGSLGIAAWSTGYLVVGAGLISSAWDPASSAGGLDRIGWVIPGVVFIPLGLAGLLYGLFRGRRGAKAKRVMHDGIQAPATITAIHDTGVTINQNPRVRIELDVQESGGGSFHAEKTITASRIALPRPGDRVTVWYDPNDHGDLVLALPDHPHRLPAPAVAASPTQTTVDDLQQLLALRDKGILTPAELETALARLSPTSR